jgi:transcriptional regulator with XRE-family HTH domain
MIIVESQKVVDALRSIRVERCIKQREIADSMNTSKSNISRLEKHVHSPTLRTLNKYADELGVELIFSVRKK